MRKRGNKPKINSEMAALSPNVLLTTLDVSSLITLTERKMSVCLKKHDLNLCCLQETQYNMQWLKGEKDKSTTILENLISSLLAIARTTLELLEATGFEN